MNNFFKQLLLFILYFQLIVGNAYAGVPIKTKTRTNDIINGILDKPTPSDLPFIDYLDNFIHDRIQPIKRLNLSKYKGKQLYIGYGLYDTNQNYCKYIEQPGLDPEHNARDKISTYFRNISTFNLHKYAISIKKMSFQQCKDLAGKFGLHVAVPTTQAENSFLNGRFPVKTNEKKWLGISKETCSNNKPYKNEEGLEQEYFDWSQFEKRNCNPSKLHIVQNSFGTWRKDNLYSQNYCLVEADSEDINRPLKVCAPWWRVERDYKKDYKTNWGGVDIYKINQADIPAQTVVCSRRKVNQPKEDAQKAKLRP